MTESSLRSHNLYLADGLYVERSEFEKGRLPQKNRSAVWNDVKILYLKHRATAIYRE